MVASKTVKTNIIMVQQSCYYFIFKCHMWSKFGFLVSCGGEALTEQPGLFNVCVNPQTSGLTCLHVQCAVLML